jgi:DNA-binding MarR family transcriptional regulator
MPDAAEKSASARAPTQPLPRSVDFTTLDSSVGYLLRRAQLAVSADFRAALATMGLRPGQFATLILIAENPDIRQSEVCTALGIQRTNFVAVVDYLESRGFARRGASMRDRRSNALSLTAAGRRALNRALELQRDHEVRMSQRLGRSGREQLLELLARILPAQSI